MDSRRPRLGAAQIHLSQDRRGRQIAQRGVGLGGKYRNIRLIHGSCQAGPGRDRSLFLDSLLADQSMEQSHSRRGGRAAHARSHTPQQSPASHTRGGRQGPGAAQVDWCSHTHHAAGAPQVGADGKPAEAPHRRAHGDDYPLELRSSLTNRLMTIGTCYWVDLYKGADAGNRGCPGPARFGYCKRVGGQSL